MKRLILTIALLALTLPSGALGADVWFAPGGSNTSPYDTEAKGATSLQTALTFASCGDTVKISDGTHDDIGDLTATTDCTSGNEITIQGETAGAAIFTGQLRLQITGAYWIVEDLVLDGIEKTTTTDDRIKAIQLRDDHITIRHNIFKNFVGITYNGFAITADNGDADNCTVEYNTFYNMRSMGVFAISSAVSMTVQYNNFDTFPVDSVDDCSAVYFGSVTADGAVTTGHVVQYNRFMYCQGDTETLGFKTAGNTAQYNVFGGSYEVSVRNGDNSIIHNNWFFGLPDYTSQGVRLRGGGHVVSNNYMEGLTGHALMFCDGDVGDSGAGNRRAHDILVIGNTIVNQNGTNTIKIFNLYTADTTNVPHALTFQNNIFDHDSAVDYMFRSTTEDDDPSFVWTTNVCYNSSGSGKYFTGFSSVPSAPAMTTLAGDPTLEVRADAEYDGIYVVGDTTDAEIRDDGTYNASYATDFDGHARNGTTPDIGCDEQDAGAVTVTLVHECNVGPDWYRPSCDAPEPPEGFPDIKLWVNFEGTVDGSTYTIGATEYSPEDSTGTLVSAVVVDVTSVKYGTYGLDSVGAADYMEFTSLTATTLPALTEITIGTWFKHPSWLDDTEIFRIRYDVSDQIICKVDDNDEIKCNHNVLVGTDLAISSANGGTPSPVAANTWYFAQLYVKPSTGVFRVELNGVEVVAYAGGAFTALNNQPTILIVGNGGNIAGGIYNDNVMISNDITRNFYADQYGGVDLADLTAYPGAAVAGTIDTATFSDTITTATTATLNLTCSGAPTINAGTYGDYPYFYLETGVNDLKMSCESVSTNDLVCTGATASPMRTPATLAFASGLYFPTGSTITVGGENINPDLPASIGGGGTINIPGSFTIGDEGTYSTFTSYLATDWGKFVPDDSNTVTSDITEPGALVLTDNGTSGHPITVNGGGYPWASDITFGDWWTVSRVKHASDIILGVSDVHTYSLIPTGSTLQIPETATGVTVYNDTIAGTLVASETCSLFKNNYVATFNGAGLGAGETFTAAYCAFGQSKATIEATLTGGTFTCGDPDTCLYSVAPLFIDAGGGDYKLLPTSPLIGKGVSIAGLHDTAGKTDYYGKALNDAKAGTVPSIGAEAVYAMVWLEGADQEVNYSLVDCADEDYIGIVISPTATGSLVQNTTVVRCARGGIAGHADGTIANTFSISDGDDISAKTGVTLTGSNNYFMDAAIAGAGAESFTNEYWSQASPFVSATDFHLKRSAVNAVNKGVNLCAGVDDPFVGCTGAGTGSWTDLDGNTVPKWGLPDIGAYEYQGRLKAKGSLIFGIPPFMFFDD